ncbi:MAG: AAA family ATPase [Acidimicrobiales bacterium]
MRVRLVGLDAELDSVISALLAGTPVVLVGPPGAGKTTIATTVCSALGIEPGWCQGSADTLPSDLTGSSIPRLADGTTVWRPGPLLTAPVTVIDELPQLPARSLAPLREALTRHQVTAPGEMSRRLPHPHWLVATGTTAEMATGALDPSLADRLVRIDIPAPTWATVIAARSCPTHVEQVASIGDLMAWRATSSAVAVPDQLGEWVADLVVASGCSIRADRDLLALARARAVLAGRDHVVPSDLSSSVHMVLSHRTPPSTLTQALHATPIPAAPRHHLIGARR